MISLLMRRSQNYHSKRRNILRIRKGIKKAIAKNLLEKDNSHECLWNVGDIPDEKDAFQMSHAFTLPSRLKTNSYHGMNYTRIPDEVLKLDSLKILNISNNNITTLPNEFATLKCLTILNMSKNSLKSIPAVLQLLPLKELFLSSNRIRHIEVKNLNKKMLKLLYIDSNSFMSLPLEITGFESLENLKLDWLRYCLPARRIVISRFRDSNNDSQAFDLNMLFADINKFCEVYKQSKINCIELIKMYSKDRVLDFKDSHGRNMAQIALSNNDTGVARCLASDSRLFIIYKDKENRSLLYYALCNRNEEVLESLVAKDPIVDQGFGAHGSALHIACFQLQADLARIFADRTTDVNKQDDFGNTPLHKLFSVFDKDPKAGRLIMEILLNHKVYLNLKNKKNHTPLALAILYKNIGAVQFAYRHNKHQEQLLSDSSMFFDFNQCCGYLNVPIYVLLFRSDNINLIVNVIELESSKIIQQSKIVKYSMDRMGYFAYAYRKIIQKKFRKEILNLLHPSVADKNERFRSNKLSVSFRIEQSLKDSTFHQFGNIEEHEINDKQIVEVQEFSHRSKLDNIFLGHGSTSENSMFQNKHANISEMKAHFHKTSYKKGKVKLKKDDFCEQQQNSESSNHDFNPEDDENIEFQWNRVSFNEGIKRTTASFNLFSHSKSIRFLIEKQKIFPTLIMKSLIGIITKNNSGVDPEISFRERIKFYRITLIESLHLVDLERLGKYTKHMIADITESLLDINPRLALEKVRHIFSLHKLLCDTQDRVSSKFYCKKEYNLVFDTAYLSPEKLLPESISKSKINFSIINRQNSRIIGEYLKNLLSALIKRYIRGITCLENNEKDESILIPKLSIELRIINYIIQCLSEDKINLQSSHLNDYKVLRSRDASSYQFLKLFSFEMLMQLNSLEKSSEIKNIRGYLAQPAIPIGDDETN